MTEELYGLRLTTNSEPLLLNRTPMMKYITSVKDGEGTELWRRETYSEVFARVNFFEAREYVLALQENQ